PGADPRCWLLVRLAWTAGGAHLEVEKVDPIGGEDAVPDERTGLLEASRLNWELADEASDGAYGRAPLTYQSASSAVAVVNGVRKPDSALAAADLQTLRTAYQRIAERTQRVQAALEDWQIQEVARTRAHLH